MRKRAVDYNLPKKIRDSFQEILTWFDENHINFRLWARDSHVFSGNNESAMLDWLDEPQDMYNNLGSLLDIKDRIERQDFSFTVLLGMGGSSLSARVFQEILAPHTINNFFIVDTIHPHAIARLEKLLDLKKTLFIVSSKSGSTIEPNLLYHYFYDRLTKAGVSDPYVHFMAITDPISPLEQESQECGFLSGPFGKPGIGGRYSGLSPFGVMPALLMDIDVKPLLLKAIEMARSLGPSICVNDNEASSLAAFMAACKKNYRDQLIIHLSPSLRPFGMWLEQLVAESLGKDDDGLVPIVAYGGISFTPAHMHVLIELDGEPIVTNELKDEPVFRMSIKDQNYLGALMFYWQMATALFASVFKLNPFDQPDVERSKTLAKELLMKGVPETQDHALKRKGLDLDQDKLGSFLMKIKPDDYLVLVSYLDETEESTDRLNELRAALQKSLEVPILVQVGPRYLHSTGQLFKGGRNNGHFLLLTAPYLEDRSSALDHHMFSDVHLSQALSDLMALKEKHRQTHYIHLNDEARGLTQLLSMV